MKVYILEQPHVQLDLATAVSFGEIHSLYTPESRRPSPYDPLFGDDMMGRLEACKYHPDNDWFCVVGSVAMNVVAISKIVEEYGRISVLLFHPGTRSYTPLRIGTFYDAQNASIVGAQGRTNGITQEDILPHSPA